MNPEEVRDALGPPDSSYRDGDYLAWDYRGYDSKGNYRAKTIKFRNGLVSGWDDYVDPTRERFETDRGRWLE
jgi:hypothetical protein